MNQECVLLTGATGFLGKVVLEELLRTHEQAEVVLLVRAKGHRTAGDRLEQLRKSACFSGLPEKRFERVRAVNGNLASENCGLDPDDRRQITQGVTRIVHCAASIDFDLSIEEAAKANTDTTLNLLDLARACERLVSIVSVSTAYVSPNAGGVPIRETLAALPWNPEELLERIRSGRVTTEELTRVTGHPNSYTLTKCLSEHLIASRFPDLPITIVRPSIISACRHYPHPGWLDSRAAFAAFVALIGAGYLRAIVAHLETVMDLVPCDVVAIHILGELFERPTDFGNQGLRIRNSVAGIENSPSIAEARDEILAFFRTYPVDQSPRLRYIGPANGRFALADYLEHTRGLGSRRVPMSAAKAKLARKQVQYVNHAFRYFTLNSFDFRTSLEWPFERDSTRSYLNTVCRGVYRHLLRGNRQSLLIGGRRFGALYREITRTASERNTLRRLGRELRRRAGSVTVDEEALSRVRDGVPEGSLVVFEPGGTLSAEETSVLCAYALLVRSHLEFSSVWIVPGARVPSEINAALERSSSAAAAPPGAALGDASVDAPTRAAAVVIAAVADRERSSSVLMSDIESLRRTLQSGAQVVPATVSIDVGSVDVPSQKTRHRGVLIPEAGLAGLRDGASGRKLLLRATRRIAESADAIQSMHLIFEGAR
ncbi:MAG: fatty acyl-CoA reductase [Spirochaetales bacterium]